MAPFFSKMSPQFWTGETGRKIRKAGKNAQLLAAFLCFPPQGNAFGLFYLPLEHIVHEVCLTLKEVTEAMGKLSEIGFCAYDLESEFVWVFEKAKHQFGEKIKDGDNMIGFVNREYKNLPKNPFLGVFFDRYSESLKLKDKRETQALMESFGRASEALREGLASPDLHLHLSSSSLNLNLNPEKSKSGAEAAEPVWPSPERLQAFYNEQKPVECPMCQTLSPARRKKLTEYLKSFPDQGWWQDVFTEMGKSQFLRGLKNSKDRRPIARGLDWLVQKGKQDEIENCVKVHDAKYRDDENEQPVSHPKGWDTLQRMKNRGSK